MAWDLQHAVGWIQDRGVRVFACVLPAGLHRSATSGANLHVVERFTRVDAERIDYEAAITDPTRFTRPWTVRFPLFADAAAQGVTSGPPLRERAESVPAW